MTNNSVGASLLEGLKQALDFVEGTRDDVRLTHYATAHEVNIEALRNRLGMTQGQFSLQFKIDTDTLTSWETGESAPPFLCHRLP
jgi:DNA-binding transcriptional regulator YiaG